MNVLQIELPHRRVNQSEKNYLLVSDWLKLVLMK